MSKRFAFHLQASIIVSFLAGSSAPTPMYGLYQAAWGFSPIALTEVFAVYALAVLASLLVVGSLSDYIGRRPVLIVAIAMQAAAMVVFATASNIEMLFAARIIQGISTGAAAGAIGAGLLDIDRAGGTLANSVTPPIGTATGALAAGALIQWLPAPTQLVYLVLLAIFVAQLVGVIAMPELAPGKPGALKSLRPHFQLPPAVRRPLLVATPALIAAWAFIGFYASLGPALVKRLVESTAPVLGGLALFVMAGSAVVSTIAFRAKDRRQLLSIGTAALIVGVAVTLVATAASSPAALFVGTAIAGLGFGAAFNGAIGSVMAEAAADQRAGVLSIIYVICYLAFGVPAVIAGAVVASTHALVATSEVYGAVVMALATVALAGTLVRSRTRSLGGMMAR
jgi:MFS family permease